MTTHETLVAGQFGSRAKAYLESAVHAAGEDLDFMARIVGERPDAAALDMGCGGGHVTFRLAPHVRKIVASDLSAEMLAVVAAEAERRGLANVETARGAAETCRCRTRRSTSSPRATARITGATCPRA